MAQESKEEEPEANLVRFLKFNVVSWLFYTDIPHILSSQLRFSKSMLCILKSSRRLGKQIDAFLQ